MSGRTAVAPGDPGSEVVLVVPGGDGPEVHSGRMVEMADGGCTIRLAVAPGSTRSGGVLLIRGRGDEITMLTAPVDPASGSSPLVALRFVKDVGNGAAEG